MRRSSSSVFIFHADTISHLMSQPYPGIIMRTTVCCQYVLLRKSVFSEIKKQPPY